jgi:N-acetylglucosamine-6-phosphate deacetylase
VTESLLLCGGTVYTEIGVFSPGAVWVEGGVIRYAGSLYEPGWPRRIRTVSLPGTCHVIPGLIDVHIHGADGADVMDGEPEALSRMARALPREGTTAFLATTITQSPDAIEKAIENVAQWMKREEIGAAECVGIHLEGPFLSPKQSGAQPSTWITDADVEQFRRWQEQAGGVIRLVTLAPERPGGMELIRYLSRTGVIASIGHSDATYAECLQAISAGASHVTHLFNGMRGMHHREPGVAGAAMLREELMVELIADGIHVCPEMVKLALRQIGSGRLTLITDAMRAKCLHSGVYDLGGQTVHVTEREARLGDGTLAGSVLKMNEALRFMHHVAGCGMEELILMASANPAREFGLWRRKGSIAPGKDADITVLGGDFEVLLTLCRGEIAHVVEGLL